MLFHWLDRASWPQCPSLAGSPAPLDFAVAASFGGPRGWAAALQRPGEPCGGTGDGDLGCCVATGRLGPSCCVHAQRWGNRALRIAPGHTILASTAGSTADLDYDLEAACIQFSPALFIYNIWYWPVCFAPPSDVGYLELRKSLRKKQQ